MDVIIDTCVLVSGAKPFLPELLASIRKKKRLLIVDDPGGPCSLEVLKHAPGVEGDLIRDQMQYSTNGMISKDVYRLYLGLLKSRCVRRISKHSGEPSMLLAVALQRVVEREGIVDWWEKDRMWVALAERAVPANICSSDRGFCRVKAVLTIHNIGLESEIPCPPE